MKNKNTKNNGEKRAHKITTETNEQKKTNQNIYVHTWMLLVNMENHFVQRDLMVVVFQN